MNLTGYLLNVSFCLAVFYLVYWLGLRKLTFFAANRLYLLLASAVSWLLPGLPLPAASLPVENPSFSWVATGLYSGRVSLPAAVTGPLTSPAAGAWTVSFEQVLLVLYLAGVAWMLFRLFVKLRKLSGLLSRAPSGSYGCYPVVQLEGPLSNASFLNTIFLDADRLDVREQALVLAHERSHLAHRHSLDVLWLEVMKAVLWFNPVVYLYGRSLQLVHEFQADAAGAGDDRRAYACLLLKLGSGPMVPSLAQSFGGLPLARRVQALFADRSRGWRRLQYLLFLPGLVAGLVLISCNRAEGLGPAAGEAPLLFLDGGERPFASMTGVDPATIANIQVYTGADAVRKAGYRARKGAIFLTTGYRAPGTGKAEFALPNGEIMTFTRTIDKTGKPHSQVQYHQPGQKDTMLMWAEEAYLETKDGKKDAFKDALALRPAFFLTFLAHYASNPGTEQPRP